MMPRQRNGECYGEMKGEMKGWMKRIGIGGKRMVVRWSVRPSRQTRNGEVGAVLLDGLHCVRSRVCELIS